MGEADGYYHQSGPPPPQQTTYQQQEPPPGNPPQQGSSGPNYGAPPPYGYNPPQSGYGNEKYSFDQAFKIQKPKWNDVWAGILLIAVFCGYTAVSGIAIRAYATSRGIQGGSIYDGANAFGLSTNTIVLFAFCLGVAVVLGYGYVMLARIFAKQFIWVTGILNIMFAFGTAIYMLYRRYYAGGIVFLIFGVLTALFFWMARRRIPFSALMLRTAITVAKNYGHVFLVSFLGGIVAVALGAWFVVTLVAVYARWAPNDQGQCAVPGQSGCSSATVGGLLAFVTFAMYWVSEWLKNTIHTTVAGVYGSWYFCSRSFPHDATRAAFRRSVTYSFGSISFGSLIVAIIQFLRQLCSIAQNQEAQQGDILSCVAFCVLGCLLGVVEWIAEFINRYAFAHIALYGKAFIPAAKDTFKMIKDRGIDALINECLVGPVLSFGAIFVAYACALLAYLYLVFTDPAYNRDGGYTVLVVAFAFVIGLQIANVFTTPISSGIDTIFVAAAWDPAVMVRDHRELYDKMVQTYPHVQAAIQA